jgi:hypothetical protein
MTKETCVALFLFPVCALAQERAATATPSPAQSRSVRISFVPPPLEGTISLGIYDENDQLVRVLHQEATFDEFTMGADALMTKWDGKDDFGYDLYPGTYHARGFLVAPMKIDEMPANESETSAAVPLLKVKLMANPLEKNERPTVQIVAGMDDDDVLLKTDDGLPLLTITQTPGIKQVSLFPREANGAGVIVETASVTRCFFVIGLNRMMAFDCGEFELKAR